MKILILEPYHTGSHKSWTEGFSRHSSHDVTVLSMEGRYWKWRMHGGAVTLARKFMEGDHSPDLLLATDMLDLTTFLSLTRRKTANIPTVLYFHENQLSYPWSPDDRDILNKRDRHYGFINYASALTADSVYFNSAYHMESFFYELPRFLKHFPDNNETESIDLIRSKSEVLPLGLDLIALDTYRPEPLPESAKPPLILWNHRWEYDKNPGEFFKALFRVADMGLDFEVAILGENFRNRPKEFDEAKERLGKKVVHFGYVKDLAEYACWLWKADILPVTSNHDFFGSSVVEAIYCDTFPLLPKRLAYPEHIPEQFHNKYFYEDFDDLPGRLEMAIKNIVTLRKEGVGNLVAKYDWREMAPVYDDTLVNLHQREKITVNKLLC